jgi:hypothetical protein
MSQTEYQSLLNRGRKSGLKTTELYQALTARQPQPAECNGQGDANGFVAHLDGHCHPVYQPAEDRKP